MFQEKRLACTLKEPPPRYILTCWKCFKDKRGTSDRELSWRLQTNLVYFPQEDDDSVGIFSCYDCEKWILKHAIRMNYRTDGYQYTRDDYVKDARVTWEASDRMTKHFVLRAEQFEKEEAARKEKERAESLKRKRKRTQPAQLAPAQVAPAPVVPATPIPDSTAQNIPDATAGPTNPNPPLDRSASAAQSTVVKVSDHADNLRRIIRTLRQPLGDDPPKISPAAADALLRELDGIDVDLHTLYSHFQ